MTSSSVQSAWAEFPDYRIDILPGRGSAIVSSGGIVLAETRDALRVVETDHVERLYFPLRDVRLDLLEQSTTRTVCPFKGEATYWSYRQGDTEIEDLFWAYAAPFDEVRDLRGHLGVYHERARVVIRCTWPDGGFSENDFGRFWGNDTDLLRLLDPDRDDSGSFHAPGYHHRERNVVEGGQLFGQAIVAASRSVPDQRVTWASMHFIRAAAFDDSVDLTVAEVRRGRTFSTLAVESSQRDRLRATSSLLLDAGSPDVFRMTVPMPSIPGPEDAEPYDMGVAGRDVRVVDGAYGPELERVGPPELHAWVRFLTSPTELGLRQALVAQASTHWTIAAGMLPHAGFGEAQAHVSLSTGPVAISMGFHDDAPLDEWFVYSTQAFWSGRGLVQGEGRVWTRSGALIASYSLQAMVRAMLDGGSSLGYESAM
jgi:acyl-CoA thioesterase II